MTEVHFWRWARKTQKRAVKFWKKLNKTASSIVIGSTSTSTTLSITGFEFIGVPKPAAVGCGKTITAKLASEFLVEQDK